MQETVLPQGTSSESSYVDSYFVAEPFRTIAYRSGLTVYEELLVRGQFVGRPGTDQDSSTPRPSASIRPSTPSPTPSGLSWMANCSSRTGNGAVCSRRSREITSTLWSNSCIRFDRSASEFVPDSTAHWSSPVGLRSPIARIARRAFRPRSPGGESSRELRATMCAGPLWKGSSTHWAAGRRTEGERREGWHALPPSRYRVDGR